MEKLNFCYIINDNKIFLDLLVRSLYSLVKYYNDNINNIYIITSVQLNDNYKNVLYRISDKIIIKNADINIVDCIKYPSEAVTADRISKIALLKFFIPYIIDCKSVIYIDSDILFYNNCTKELIRYIDDTLMLKLFTNYHIINSGIIYINCDIWRNKENIIEEIKKYYELDSIKHYFVDQSCFTYLMSFLYKDDCITDTHNNINIDTKLDELKNKQLENDFFIFHAIGDDKKFFLDVFDYYIKDDKFDELNYKNLYFI